MTHSEFERIVTKPGWYHIVLNDSDVEFKAGSDIVYWDTEQLEEKGEGGIRIKSKPLVISWGLSFYSNPKGSVIYYDAIEKIIPMEDLLNQIR